MKRLRLLVFTMMCLFVLVSCSKKPEILNPYTQEYIAGQGNIKGQVNVERHLHRSEYFDIGATKDGWAVFKDPEKAFTTFKELYSDELEHMKYEFDLMEISEKHYEPYLQYSSYSNTCISGDYCEDAYYIGSFLDIYENSYKAEYSN